MAYIALILFALVCGFALLNWMVNAEPKSVLRGLKWIGIGFLLLAIIGLAFSGRLAWLAAVFPFLFVWVPRVQFLYTVIRKIRGYFRGDDRARSKDQTSSMTRQEAFAILELPEDASEPEIKAAYHRLIAIHHPDKGGSSDMAAKLNQARDLLLK